MAKSTKAKGGKTTTSDTAIKKAVEKPVENNRLPIELNPSDDPKRKKQREYYYANQERLVAQKRQYYAEIREGKRTPVSRKPRKPATKLTPKEQSIINRRKSKREWWEKNKERINKEKQEKREKTKEEIKQKILDEFKKINEQ